MAVKRILLLLLIASAASDAQIYKWTDESGGVYFSDKAAEGATVETVKLQINSYEHVSYEAMPVDVSKNENGNKKVVMYSASWCGYCRKARNYFNAQGIAFTELDIERNSRAKKEYDSMGGRGVPVILVGKKRMNGFSIAGFTTIYE
ncbi:MAG: glutaredoxin [Halioglobus sp.]|jgi:glutaredoxin